MKKLIPAICLLLVSAVMLGTSTFAWFSMNATVAVTGMSVRATVSENISIASCAVNATAKQADSAFKYGYVMTHTEQLLEPVSAVDGATFFYTSTKNVKADGDAMTDTYVAYDHASTTAFDTNYGTDGAKGYVEYAMQLKADNSSDSAKYVNLTDVNLTYGGTAAAQKAFRVAVFVDDMGTDGATAANASQTSGNLKSILAISGATYQTSGKAVASTSALGDLTAGKLNTAANIGTVAAHTSNYYKVVVRLWIEGEDTTCTNATFANLTDKWAFDLLFKLQDATGGATVITQNVTASKVVLTSATSGSTPKVVDGETYYEINDHSGYYTKSASTAVAYNTTIYHIDAYDIVLDVTNQCTLPAAP